MNANLVAARAEERASAVTYHRQHNYGSHPGQSGESRNPLQYSFLNRVRDVTTRGPAGDPDQQPRPRRRALCPAP